MKRYLIGLITILMIISIVGCGKAALNEKKSETSSGKSASTDKEITLGFSFGQSVHPFFIAMEKGARDAAEKAGVKLLVTSANYKIENQISNVEDLIQQKVDAILLNPIDSKAIAPAVNAANNAKIPVITVDIAAVGAPTAAHVASDNKAIGGIAAKYIIQKLNGKGKIAMITWPTITSCLDREVGFEEVMKNEGKDIQIVAKQDGGMERAKALSVAENILQAHPDIQAIFAVNESAAMGALSAVQSRGLKDIFIIGVDSTPDNLKAIKDKTQLTATVAQNPYEMGKVAVELALKKLKGENIPTWNPIPTDLVTIDNVDKFLAREAEYKK
ncbi:D-ribose ABC transporter substrate-binding protein [Moorella sp. E308F]|uniref:sugar ABC transporter substrate-binding protein n=1 Tax=Moorella sp. E308F TaxID=2572682 RepID=UPI0010FFB18F|nr:substrate-binding domain-containing protein [Moorella sp. E308F]GEA14968.1 D-ribose ABC transporter substrate-binding protein [Moorella sp. E308F]